MHCSVRTRALCCHWRAAGSGRCRAKRRRWRSGATSPRPALTRPPPATPHHARARARAVCAPDWDARARGAPVAHHQGRKPKVAGHAGGHCGVSCATSTHRLPNSIRSEPASQPASQLSSRRWPGWSPAAAPLGSAAGPPRRPRRPSAPPPPPLLAAVRQPSMSAAAPLPHSHERAHCLPAALPTPVHSTEGHCM